jgi:hypothetical protein
MNFCALGDGDIGKGHLPGHNGHSAGVRMQPRRKNNLKSALHLAELLSQRFSHEAVVHLLADLRQVLCRDISWEELGIVGARLPVFFPEWEDRANGKDGDVPAVAQMTQKIRVIESAMRIPRIGKMGGDE